MWIIDTLSLAYELRNPESGSFESAQTWVDAKIGIKKKLQSLVRFCSFLLGVKIDYLSVSVKTRPSAPDGILIRNRCDSVDAISTTSAYWL